MLVSFSYYLHFLEAFLLECFLYAFLSSTLTWLCYLQSPRNSLFRAHMVLTNILYSCWVSIAVTAREKKWEQTYQGLQPHAYTLMQYFFLNYCKSIYFRFWSSVDPVYVYVDLVLSIHACEHTNLGLGADRSYATSIAPGFTCLRPCT